MRTVSYELESDWTSTNPSLPLGFQMMIDSNKISQVYFKFEKLSMFYDHCGRVGHEKETCFCEQNKGYGLELRAELEKKVHKEDSLE